MFERRLKIFLACIVAVAVLLVLRTMQIQILRADAQQNAAKAQSAKTTYLPTVRGRLLDFKGRPLAIEVPSIDAAVDYRAIGIEPDAEWCKTIADQRLRRRLGDDYTKLPKKQRDVMLKDELLAVHTDIEHLWAALAKCPGMDEQKINDTREAIVDRVETRQRSLWQRAVSKATTRAATATTRPWYQRWFAADSRPDLDSLFKKIDDQTSPQIVVENLDADTVTALGKNIDRFPGLVLQPGNHRAYPQGAAACHVIGYVSPVSRDDLDADPEQTDPTRKLGVNDVVGRSGLEKLAEPALRGTRGKVIHAVEPSIPDDTTSASPGLDVRSTIDIELQEKIQQAFNDVTIHMGSNPEWVCPALHGAAVVLDVPTGQVRAMVSVPTFDLNTLSDNYAALLGDKLDAPLMNRATFRAVVPGSSVKPAVGLWGMTRGVLGINETFKCEGQLRLLNGRLVDYGHCWVYKVVKEHNLGSTVDHPVPTEAPLLHDLNFAEALERSCNPFHETVAMKLGMEQLDEGFHAFGLGLRTGVGIAESPGRLPQVKADESPAERTKRTALMGIGQGDVAATPLQMANEAATVGRGGIWVRPSLIAADDSVSARLPYDPLPDGRPDRFDLHIPPAAIAMAKQGMYLVVHGGVAATGANIEFSELDLCGKTGTAQVDPLMMESRDAAGQPELMYDVNGSPLLNKKGEPVRKSTSRPTSFAGSINPDTPWYLGTGKTHYDIAHAWYIGFVPKEHPKIAFAVLVEYGGSGGGPAAAVAKRLLQACIDEHYISLQEDGRRDPPELIRN